MPIRKSLIPLLACLLAVASPDARADEPGWAGWRLGVSPGDEPCVLIEAVVAGGPAAAAGLLAGDQMVLLEGRPILIEKDDLLGALVSISATIRASSAGERLQVTIRRDREQVTVTIELGSLDASLQALRNGVSPLNERLERLDVLCGEGESRALPGLLALSRDRAVDTELRLNALGHVRYLADIETLHQLRAAAPPADDPVALEWSRTIFVIEDRLQRSAALMDIGRVMSWIRDRYLDAEAVHLDQLTNSAIRGMLEQLDVYSDLQTPEQLRDRRQNRYRGIGITLESRNGRHLASRVFPGGRARELLEPDDEILAVDGVVVTGLERGEVVERIRGEDGEILELTVRRFGSEEPVVVRIERGSIQRPVVEWRMLPGEIGYLRLNAFSSRASEEVASAIDLLSDQGVRALVLDLRGNRGGSVDEVQRIAGVFLAPGKLVAFSKGREEFFPRRDLHALTMPVTWPGAVVTLIDGGTASAAEMLAGALRAHGRSELVGEQSFGKGVGQSTFDLDSAVGRRFVKLTTFRYHLPDSSTVHEVGLEPDVAVSAEDPEGTIAAEIFRLRCEGALARYLNERIGEDIGLLVAATFYDGSDEIETRFPGFEDWRAELDTSLTDASLLDGLRVFLRRVTEHRLGSEFVCDVEGDRQLHAAIVRVAAHADLDLSMLPMYTRFLSAEVTPSAGDGDQPETTR